MSDRRQKLALGTAQFGLPYGIANQCGKLPQDVVKYILNEACDSGVDTLDTAIAYGESEKVLGFQNLQDFSVISKLPEVPRDCCNITNWAEQQVLASLSRLKIDSLDALLLHRPNQLLESGGQELYESMVMLKAKGLVSKIGISVYGPEELHELIKHFKFDIVQAPMNVFDRRMETSGLLRDLKNEGVEVHIRSAFLQGLLLMSEEEVPTYFKPWSELFGLYHNWLRANDIAPLHACLSYLNQHPDIDRIIVGVDSLQQLKEIIMAIDKPLQEIPDSLQSTDEHLINPSRWQL
jgi:aryl-alcohol dehydrogenase-like predicted oxidoreductase